MSVNELIKARLTALADKTQAAHLARFFKTGPGEYGEGDIFLGIRCPQTRSIVKEFKNHVDLEDIRILTASKYHEIRLAGFLLLIEIYKKLKKRNDTDSLRLITDYYLSIIERGNNWDLVDMVAPKILGDWLTYNPDQRFILDQLAAMNNSLWHRRVGMVANWTIIRNHEFDDTFRIAEKLMHDPHDLIHKASGWMLRETGKHGGKDELLAFLDRHATVMPRTMLRYAIEHFPKQEREHYLGLRAKLRFTSQPKENRP